MSDAGKREWRFYIDDMLEFAEKVVTYTSGLDHTGFVTNGLTYDATLCNLEFSVKRLPTFLNRSAPPMQKFHGE